MKITKVDFIKSASKEQNYPNFNFPEFAFLGRSNVGKSSLINMLTGRKSLVKTGARPGVTQLINFFLVNEKFSLVDLPGFGFANAPKNIRKQFMPMVKSYISGRKNLKLLFLLIDIRRTPKDFEQEMIDFILSNNLPVAITCTKADKLTCNKMNQQKNLIAENLKVNKEWIFLTSAQNKLGRKEILSVISQYILQN